jgi:hypothetical protein
VSLTQPRQGKLRETDVKLNGVVAPVESKLCGEALEGVIDSWLPVTFENFESFPLSVKN